jgi:Fur family transcriptional regulator, peroxide stress response regulator
MRFRPQHPKESGQQLDEQLARKGFRFTPQREQVYSVLLTERDHPTAEQVFIRAKKIMPEISIATVYNCLDALVQCGLVREVNLDRTATRYCPNMEDHGHFCCLECGEVYDIAFKSDEPQPELPRGFQVTSYHVSMRGTCANCASGKQKN